MIFTEKCLIRFARAEDYRKVEEIMKQVQALHVQWRPDIYKAADPVWAEEDFLSEVNKETVIVAELSGNVVALLSISFPLCIGISHPIRRLQGMCCSLTAWVWMSRSVAKELAISSLISLGNLPGKRSATALRCR